MAQSTSKSKVSSTKSDRADILRIFAAMPDEAFAELKVFAAVLAVSENTARARINEDPCAPRLIKLSPRCTRVRAGDIRAYLRAKEAA